MRSTPLYAPDGMASFGAVQAHDRYDDGLVHNHHWAVTAMPDQRDVDAGYFDVGAVAVSGRMSSAAGFTSVTSTHQFQAYGAVHADDRYDDGLVHNHEWAVTGK